MPYVDGFVLPLPTANLEQYREMAELSATVWREHGALEYRECIADDVKPGQLTSFPQAVQLQEGETVVLAWVVYPSRAVRDQVNEKVMKDPRLAHMMDPRSLPFDGKRMFFGGFEMMIDR